MRSRFAFGLVALVFVLQACTPVSPIPNGSSDMSAPPTDALDCDASPSSCGCTSDSQCGGDTPRCDRNSDKCQPCLPTDDTCPTGSHCVPVNDGYQCSTRCRNDADCPKTMSGGAQVCCSGACLDVTMDTKNCGACGNVCAALPNATTACVAGSCAVDTCAAGFVDCDKAVASGCEVNTADDVKNCGACGKACAAGPSSTARCNMGTCALDCAAGFADCDGNPTNGCEVNTVLDAANCGGCGKSCGSPANGAAACMSGACVLASCKAGFADCDQSLATGCETSTLTDAMSCGACGHVCSFAHASGACMVGVCKLSACDPGYDNCDGVGSNGCETATGSDANSCGSCGHSCGGPNSNQVCTSGVCVVQSCSSGYADCDGNPSNGCEVQIGSDIANCGGCGKACSAPANATSACTNGMCVVGSCKFGYSDCDMNPANGCEANLLAPTSCGFCGNVCSAPPNATAGCAAGSCGIGACNALWGDCDGLAGNGCEKSLATDIANCGACGKACSYANAQALCLGGQCGIGTCNSGYADCDNNPANGCETSTTGNTSNCGGCGIVCGPSKPNCINGACLAGPVCDPATEVSYNNRCYYLDGSGGYCDSGYSLASQTVLSTIASSFVGKTYKHAVSDNCCIYNADSYEAWGFAYPAQCNVAGPFSQGPIAGGAGCTNSTNRYPAQLTLCFK